MRTLLARGAELERDFALGVVRQLFEPAVGSLSAAELEQVFAGAAALTARMLGRTGVQERREISPYDDFAKPTNPVEPQLGNAREACARSEMRQHANVGARVRIWSNAVPAAMVVATLHLVACASQMLIHQRACPTSQMSLSAPGARAVCGRAVSILFAQTRSTRTLPASTSRACEVPMTSFSRIGDQGRHAPRARSRLIPSAAVAHAASSSAGKAKDPPGRWSCGAVRLASDLIAERGWALAVNPQERVIATIGQKRPRPRGRANARKSRRVSGGGCERALVPPD